MAFRRRGRPGRRRRRSSVSRRGKMKPRPGRIGWRM